jgi:hypothetical protein
VQPSNSHRNWPAELKIDQLVFRELGRKTYCRGLPVVFAGESVGGVRFSEREELSFVDLWVISIA